MSAASVAERLRAAGYTDADAVADGYTGFAEAAGDADVNGWTCEVEHAAGIEVVVAWDRTEADACQAGTPGCCVDHAACPHGCETW